MERFKEFSFRRKLIIAVLALCAIAALFDKRDNVKSFSFFAIVIFIFYKLPISDKSNSGQISDSSNYIYDDDNFQEEDDAYHLMKQEEERIAEEHRQNQEMLDRINRLS